MCFKAGYKVRANDEIEFPDLQKETLNIKNLLKDKFDLQILYEDDDYLFINKPCGLSVHPTSPTQTNTLVNKLLDLHETLPKTNILRPGIVHRLDKDTSGVIVIAKTPRALWWLSGQFAERKVKKEYLSIGLNQDIKFRYKKGSTFEFEGFLLRSLKNRKQFSIERLNKRSKPQGRFSKSQFEILDIFNVDQSNHVVFTKIHPLTGRTHQIRVHQKELGFVIIKDPIYMSKKQLNWSSEFLQYYNLAQRLYLHAYSITFENYDGRVYSVCAQLPQEFDLFLNHAAQSQKR